MLLLWPVLLPSVYICCNNIRLSLFPRYKDLISLLDAQFPPLASSGDRNREGGKLKTSLSRMQSEDYSSFVYWKKSLDSFDEVDLPPI